MTLTELWMLPFRSSGAINAESDPWIDDQWHEPASPLSLRNSQLSVGIPVSLAKRLPTRDEKNKHGRCYYGSWSEDDQKWCWSLRRESRTWDTHFISVFAEALPTTCFPSNEL